MRRTFRRYIRKTLSQNVPPVLQEANFAFDKGEYGRAAELYEDIARTADARGGPRAPLFHLQAGRARVYAGQSKLGFPSLKRGLELFAERGQMHKLHQAGNRVVNELKARGLQAEAAELDAWLVNYSSSGSMTEPRYSLARGPALPTHCPSCGAPVRADEVEWLNEGTAECAYCGSPIGSG
jgi:hypothetical protein